MQCSTLLTLSDGMAWVRSGCNQTSMPMESTHTKAYTMRSATLIKLLNCCSFHIKESSKLFPNFQHIRLAYYGSNLIAINRRESWRVNGGCCRCKTKTTLRNYSSALRNRNCIVNRNGMLARAVPVLQRSTCCLRVDTSAVSLCTSVPFHCGCACVYYVLFLFAKRVLLV